jgi:hypothetical protein
MVLNLNKWEVYFFVAAPFQETQRGLLPSIQITRFLIGAPAQVEIY